MIIDSLHNMRQLDEVARQETIIHKIHPLMKLLTTVIFIIVVVSFDRYAIGRILPLILYPMLLFVVGEIKVAIVVRRLLIVSPLILGIGILNPILVRETLMFAGYSISVGWLIFFSILIKSILTITVSILLIATTGMESLAMALRKLHLPKIFVMQLLLTYRYISVLVEEVFRMQRAYSLRSPQKQGVQIKAWGSFAGQLLLRAFERAERVYVAMKLKGFQGEYYTGKATAVKVKDLMYMICWSCFFISVRIYNLPDVLNSLLESLILGGIV